MPLIVVDASVLVDTLVGEGRAVDRLATEELAAPHLLDAEVASVIRRKSLSGELDANVASRALADFIEIELIRYPHTHLLPRVWELGSNLTPYDALYVALAEALDVTLLTLDGRIAGAPGLRAAVEVLATS